MIVKVWEPPEPKPEPEKVVRLRLVQDDEDAEVNAVALHGGHGCELFVVGPDGLRRVGGVPPALGFPLDDKGRIKLVGEN